ncbi:pentatricopeptide repeat-containing protein, partial [Tanacetum coccineum]
LTAVNCLLIYPRSCDCNYRWTAKSSDAQRSEKFKRDSLYIDKQGKLTSFNHKKVSRKGVLILDRYINCHLSMQIDADSSFGTYNDFLQGSLCENADEYIEKLQETGIEPDVYAYNALMEAYSRAGFPYGAAEIFSLMQHMGCEPDRASFNIMVDAYGRSGLHEGKTSY